MKRIKKVITDYSHLRVNDISPFSRAVVASMSANPNFPDADELLRPLLVAVDSLDAFVTAHPAMTKPLTAEVLVLRLNVLAALSDVAIEVNKRYAGDDAALLSSGLEMAADPHPQVPPLAPKTCIISDGLQSGSMVVTIKRAPGTDNVEWYYTTDPALPLTQWKRRLLNADEITLIGLTAGDRLYVRVACINGASTTENLVFVEAKPCYVE